MALFRSLKNDFCMETCYYQDERWGSLIYVNVGLILYSTVSVHNVSLIPSKNQLTVREGIQKVIHCVVNRNADPVPTITWYLGSTDITSRAGTNTTSITLTGNRTDNGRTLECRATNDNKPPKIGNTTLNVECKFKDIGSKYLYKKLNWKF